MEELERDQPPHFFDLGIEPADIGKRGLGWLFREETLTGGAWQPFERHQHTAVETDHISGRQAVIPETAGNVQRYFFVAAADHNPGLV
jgi:hypothetical protein